MKKYFITIVSCIALLGLLLTIKSCSNDGLLKVRTEMSAIRSITETVSANGKIQPEVEVKISADVSGEIVELMVKEGDHVEKGTLLVKIRPDIYQSNLQRMEASLNTSKANLSNAKARLEQVKAQFSNAESSFKRNKKLFDQGAISAADFDAAKASYESALSDVKAAEENVNASMFTVKSSEASLKEASDNLAKTEIFSPVNGTISQLNVELGERVVGTSQMAGTEIMRIANLNEMEVSVDVNENDIVRVSLKDTAVIEVDAYIDRKFKGVVTEIANSANIEGISADQVTNFTVKIRILQESYADLLDSNNLFASPFRPGMSATVDIQTQHSGNIVTVPIQAVTTRVDTVEATLENKKADPESADETFEVKDTRKKTNTSQKDQLEPQEVLFVFEEGVAKMIPIKTGIQDANYIEIKSGLKEGIEVITGPYLAVSRVLKEGMEVAKKEESKSKKIPSK